MPIGHERYLEKEPRQCECQPILSEAARLKYPPKADDSHWVTTNHIAATVPKAVGDGFKNDHGETVVSPRPGPSVNKMSGHTEGS